MDRRFAVHRVLPESEALDYANDVLALSQEGRLHLERAYQAHVMNDWPEYLDETESIHRSFVALGALLVVAIVVIAVGWFGLTVWLSAIQYMESAVR